MVIEKKNKGSIALDAKVVAVVTPSKPEQEESTRVDIARQTRNCSMLERELPGAVSLVSSEVGKSGEITDLTGQNSEHERATIDGHSGQITVQEVKGTENEHLVHQKKASTPHQSTWIDQIEQEEQQADQNDFTGNGAAASVFAQELNGSDAKSLYKSENTTITETLQTGGNDITKLIVRATQQAPQVGNYLSMNEAIYQKGSQGILGKGHIQKAKLNEFGNLKYCDEIEKEARHKSIRSRSLPPNKVAQITILKEGVEKIEAEALHKGQNSKFHTELPIYFDHIFYNPDNDQLKWSDIMTTDVLVTRRSVPPTGRTSSKLSSLTTKIDIMEYREDKPRSQIWPKEVNEKRRLQSRKGTTRDKYQTDTPNHKAHHSQSAPNHTNRRGRGHNRGQVQRRNGKGPA